MNNRHCPECGQEKPQRLDLITYVADDFGTMSASVIDLYNAGLIDKAEARGILFTNG